jgi:hypothetical protein
MSHPKSELPVISLGTGTYEQVAGGDEEESCNPGPAECPAWAV